MNNPLIGIPLSEAVDMSGLCMTAYSTWFFDFAQKMKAIVSINYVTLNSLFFTDVQRKVGLTVCNEGELKDIIRSMKIEDGFYRYRRNRYAQLK